MVSAEQYFPRGGKKPKESFNERKKFDFLGNADRVLKKRKYRAPKIVPESEDDEHLSDVSYESDTEGIKLVSAEGLSEKTLQEGMIIMGRVMNIFDTKVIVSLPGRLSGVVMACHISAPYSKLLKSFVDDEIEDMTRLPGILKMGEYISVRVLSIVSNVGKRNSITLSMMPQDVNKGIHFSHLKEGMLLSTAVESIEDHGYVVDMGIPNCRSFLPSKYADKDLTIEIGQVIWCVIKKCEPSGTNAIVTVSNSLESIQSTCISGDSVHNYQMISDLRPGMAVNFHVNKPLSDGAEGSVLSDSTGYIHVSQIGAKVQVGKRVKARLLYVMPVTKFGFFTTRKIFETLKPPLHEEAHLKAGAVIENAQVTKVTASSVILKFDKIIGIMKLNQSAYPKNKINEAYPIGSQHTVRIIYYHLSDYAYICSDKENILEQKYFNMADLTVGEIVDAVVENVLEKGVSIKLGKIKGWISKLHVSDVGLFEQTKSNSKVTTSLAAKKFKPGQEIKARVLKVNPSISVLHLTAKPTLLDPELVILSKYEDAKVGYQYKGVIVHHFHFGVMVAFFGEVKAIVQKNQLSHETVSNIPSAFLIGQVVNCTILSVDIEACKINGSFIQEGHIDDKMKKKNKKSKKRKNSEEMNECSDIISEPSKKKKKKKRECAEEINESIPKNDNENNEPVKKIKNKKESSESHGTFSSKIDVDVPEKKKKREKVKTPLIDSKSSVDSESESKKSKKPLAKEKAVSKGIGKVSPFGNDAEITNRKKQQHETVQQSQQESVEGPEKKKKKKKSDEDKVKKNVNSENEKNVNKLSSEGPKFSSMGNFWELNADTIAKNISKNTNDSSSESEVEKVDDKIKKKKKKMTAAEKVDKARQEEEKLREVEHELSKADSQPQSSDQFERLLLANPNSSELWIAYMAFHLQATEIERARSVGRKALKTISFREEQDKLNVWLALLNIENRFGTMESLTHTLQEALQMNNPFDVHSKMLDMYLDTGKEDELQSLVDIMVAKYRSNPQTYILTGEVLYKLKLVDRARSVMQKAISRLENKAHIPVLIKFAHLENIHGDSERAEALFEQIIGVMPQRVDIWCVYVDMLLKSHKIDSLRLVFERAVSQKLPLRKMKTMYKKWVEIEEKLGNSDQVERIREMAMEYINKVKC